MKLIVTMVIDAHITGEQEKESLMNEISCADTLLYSVLKDNFFINAVEIPIDQITTQD